VIFGVFILVAACNNSQPAAPPQPASPAPMQLPPQPAPVAQPQVAVPAPPPATPLVPVAEPVAEPATPKKGSSSGGSINAPLPGKGTTGDELIGNYKCSIESKKLSIGPIKPPPFGCKIYRSEGGDLKISSTSDGAGSMKGNITDPKSGGFFVSGQYEAAGNKLGIKSRMKLTSPGNYKGKGQGVFNEDKSSKIDYTMTMKRQ